MYVDIAALRARKQALGAAAHAVMIEARAAGREQLTRAEQQRFSDLITEMGGIDEEIDRGLQINSHPLLNRGGGGGGGRRSDAATHARHWAAETANRIASTFGERRAVVTGTIDVPSLVLPYVVETPWPVRLIDLIVNRQATESNAFEFYQQVARTNNAAPVADLAQKPTSVFTLEAHDDRCRVIAHLSQPVP